MRASAVLDQWYALAYGLPSTPWERSARATTASTGALLDQEARPTTAGRGWPVVSHTDDRRPQPKSDSFGGQIHFGMAAPALVTLGETRQEQPTTGGYASLSARSRAVSATDFGSSHVVRIATDTPESGCLIALADHVGQEPPWETVRRPMCSRMRTPQA